MSMSYVMVKESGERLIEILVARRVGRNIGGEKSDV